jgi:saposin
MGKERCHSLLSSVKDLGRYENEGVGICNVLTICDSHIYVGDLNFGSNVCEDCKKIIEDVRALIRDNATAEGLINKFNSLICDNLPGSFMDFCKENVRLHVPAILRSIDEHISPECVCSSINLCPGCNDTGVSKLTNFDETVNPTAEIASKNEDCLRQNKFSWISRPTAHNSPMWTSYSDPSQHVLPSEPPSCSECQAVLNQMKQTISNPEMKSMVKKNIDEKLCNRLGTVLRELCLRAVDENLDEILQQMEKTDTREVCQTFGMCSASENCVSQQSRQLKDEEELSLPVLCPLCEMITTKLVDLIAHEPTEEEVRDALDRVCTLLPLNLKPKCIKFVDEYGAKIIHYLIKGSTPKFICVLIGACDAAEKPAELPSQPFGDGTCDTCKVLVQITYNMLLQNKTEEELKEILKNACHRIHIPFTEKCDEWVEKYLPDILQFLEQKFTPDKVCKSIGLCQASPDRNICLRGPSYWCLNTETASLCHATEFCLASAWNKAIRTSSGNICTGLSMDEICMSLELADKCDKTGECWARKMQHYLKMVLGDANVHVQSGTSFPLAANCTVCKLLVDRWKLHQKLFGAPIADDNICLIFSNESERKQCEFVWNRRNDVFERLFRDQKDSESLCKSMDLCQNSFPKSEKPEFSRALLLACADGPSYWCSSRRAAENCGTVNYCNALGRFGGSTTSTSMDVKPNVQDSVTDVLGQNVCDWGATYYCQSKERAQKCGEDAVRHCETHVWPKHEEAGEKIEAQTVEPLGKNPCTWGPAYWCSSEQNARSCGPRAVAECRRLKEFKPLKEA